METTWRDHAFIAAAAEERLFAHLAEAIPGLSRHKARMAVSAGLVRVAGEPCLEPTAAVSRGTAVTCDLRHGIPAKPHLAADRLADEHHRQHRVTILHQDDHLVVVDKAPGMLAAPSQRGERGHVPEHLRRLLRRRGDDAGFIGIVHRIDKETSGCLVFARTAAARSLLAEQFASHAAERTYRALVAGGPRQDEDVLAGRIGRANDGRRAVVDDEETGKSARTRFRVVQRFPAATELELRLETGRTHQVRVHLADIGCPVIGDPVYGLRRASRGRHVGQDLPKAPRMMLHAASLALDHPADGRRLVVEAPLPEIWQRYRAGLERRR